MLLTSIFSLSHSVFEWLLFQSCKKLESCGRGLARSIDQASIFSSSREGKNVQSNFNKHTLILRIADPALPPFQSQNFVTSATIAKLPIIAAYMHRSKISNPVVN